MVDFGAFMEGFGRGASQGAQIRSAREGRKARQQQLELEEKKFRERLGFDREKFEFDKQKDERQQKLDALRIDQEKRKADIEDKKLKIEVLKLDMTVNDSLLKVTDSKLPKAVRVLMLKRLAPKLGVDPNSTEFKDFSKMMTSLDPDDLEGLKETLLAAHPELRPGEATQFATAILSGKMDITEASDMLDKRAKRAVEGQFTLNPNEIRFGAKGEEIARNTLPPPNEPTETIADPEASTGRRIVRRGDAIGKEAPKPGKQVDPEGEMFADLDKAQLKPLIEDAQKAQRLKNQVTTFKTALASDRFTTGTLANARSSIGRLMTFFNMDPEAIPGIGDPATAEVLEATSNQIATNMAEQMSRVTNLSLTLIKDAVPNLVKTPDGNKIIADVLDRTADRQIALKDLLDKYVTEHGSLRPAGKPTFYQAARELDKKNPVVDEELKKRIEAGARKGAGVSFREMKDSAEAITGKPGKIILGGKEYTLGEKSKSGLDQVEIENPGLFQGSSTVPVARSADDVKKLKKGDQFIWGPTGKWLKKVTD